MTICKNLVTDFTASNFTENEPLYVPTEHYSYGDEAREGHYIYKSRIAGADSNKGNLPSISPLSWKKVRPSNYYAMLDGISLTQTINAGSIDVTFVSSGFDIVSLVNVQGLSVRVVVTDLNTNTVVMDKTKELVDNSRIFDFYSYCFEPISYLEDFFTRIPIYYNTSIRVIINGIHGYAKCGTLVSGRSIFIGSAKWGVGFDLESWGTSTVDEFGYNDLEHTNSVYNDSYTINIESSKLRLLQRKLRQLDFVPILFVGDENDDSKFENLVDYGYWETIRLILENPVNSTIEITKKGLV